MRDYLEPMLGTTGATIAQFAITLIVIAAVILVVFWLIRTFTGSAGTAAIRGRQPRLGLIDALPIDQKRRLVLVRRDNVEHLILIGGGTDLVVEGAIQRPTAAQRRADAAARGQPRRAAPAVEAEPAETASEPFAADHAQNTATEAEPVYEPLPEAQPEPHRQESHRQEPHREDEQPGGDNWVPPVRVERSREARASDPLAAELRSNDRRATSAPEPRFEGASEPARFAEPEPVIVLPPPAETAEDVPPPPAEERPERGSRSFGSFFSSSRNRAPQAEPEPRRPEPPRRPMSRATPVAPPRESEAVYEVEIEAEALRIEPAAEEPAPRIEPVRAEPSRSETLRSERLRSSTPRPVMPPAPPVAPPTLGEAPYGAPVADPDQPLRFEPIFDIDPANQAEPVRPVRQSRDTYVAPSVEMARADYEVEPQAAESEDRHQGVGDLEKEMARLLGEISNTRRS